jgi:hypothetical protein
MITNAALRDILLNTAESRLSTVCEVYPAAAVPGADGFDPVDAIDCFAAVDGITFRTRDYKKLVADFGGIKRTIGDETNTASVTFSNSTREIAEFEFTNGFEGLILVVRQIHRGLSTLLSESLTLFAGSCDKPKSGSRKSLTVSARSILSGQSVIIPRRKFTKEDAKGREATDPEFEGFIVLPQTGSVLYTTREKRGGILGFFGFKKTVRHTLQWSSVSDDLSGKGVPVIFGYAQIMLTHVSYEDVGIAIRMKSAVCDGLIEDLINVRSLDTRLPLSSTSYAEFYGERGTANSLNQAWVTPGWFSRTAMLESQADNSAVDETDPAPDIVAIVKGLKLMTPDGSGDWVTKQWTDNPAAVLYYLLVGTDWGPDYYSLNESWLDIDSFNEVHRYNAEMIFDLSSSDYIFVD